MEEDARNPLPRLKLAAGQRGFSTLIGPFYEIALDHGMRRALLLEPRHLSPAGVVQGGVISSFGEFVLHRGIVDEVGEELPMATVELNCQFLAASFAQRWIYGEAQVLRRTRSLVFAAGEIFDQRRRIALVSGIWKQIETGGE
ncbi:MAG: PaaI family thioesterase [Xanthomonadales bacterium]|nr:PaaI family thioesterase [Xanthomonadales bacterium]MCB1610608.1 PaaI family thioesterase [Xanthomonadales bacterium]MCP5475964.1 PaaI family thioesterase [Rhodanobacteraceae bacterium]